MKSDSGINNKSGGLLLKPAKLTDNDVKTYEENTKAYKESISPFHIEPDLNTKTKVQDRIDEAAAGNTKCQVTAQLSLTEKSELYILIKSKGCTGLTSFLKLLAKSERVEIKI